MADLLAMLGTANSNPATSSGTNTNTAPEPLVTLKAGKMTHTLNPDNGKYKISPELARGQIEVHKSTATTTSTGATNANKNLRIQWRDRRSKQVDSTFCDLLVFEGDESKFEHVQDRIFLLSTTGDHFTFFWLQDVNTEQDEDLTKTIAGYVHHPASAYPADSSNTATNTTTSTTNPAAAMTTTSNDNLGNILESVRSSTANSNANATSSATSQQPVTTGASSSSTSATPAAATSQLTLADLQGAMAGLATSASNANANANASSNVTPLTEIATPEHIRESGILEDEAVKNKLISLLPEGQQTEEHLLQHLSAPQVRSALQSLTAALASGPEGFHGVVMNFQLPVDAAAHSNANPIQAFLDCLVAQVEREGDDADDADGNDNGGEEKDEAKDD